MNNLKSTTHELNEYTLNWIKTRSIRDVWRVKGYEQEDLFQEGLFCYAKVIKKVEKGDLSFDNDHHLYSYIKRSVENHFHTLALKANKDPVLFENGIPFSDTEDTFSLEDMFGEESNIELQAIENAPSIIRRIYNLLGSELFANLIANHPAKEGTASYNVLICECLGIDHTQYDLIETFKQYMR